MPRGHLPKAYLRLDPEIHRKHPDLGSYVALLCEAAHQDPRGRFRERKILENLFGRAKVNAFLKRGDLTKQKDGCLYVDGWDEWQEGDFTVAERMRNLRARKKLRVEHRQERAPIAVTPGVTVGVTLPSPDRIAPSEASGVQATRRRSPTGLPAREPARPPGDDREGFPGEAEAIRQELATELPLAAAATHIPADALLARASRTPSGSVITNPAGCGSVPWLRTTIDRMRGMRLSAEADQAEDAQARASPRPTAAARAREAAATAMIRSGLIGDGTLGGDDDGQRQGVVGGDGSAPRVLPGQGPERAHAVAAGPGVPAGSRPPDR